MPSVIRGQVVVLTGAAQGIGANYARFLASDGVKLLMTGVDEAGLKALAAEIGNSGGTVVPFGSTFPQLRFCYPRTARLLPVRPSMWTEARCFTRAHIGRLLE